MYFDNCLVCFFVFYGVAVFCIKNVIFRKVVFGFSESITFEGQVAIWRVSAPAKIMKKCPGEEKKHDAKTNVKFQETNEKVQTTDLNNVSRMPSPIRCLQLFKHKKRKEIEGRKVSFFEVQGRLLTSKKERKKETFRKVKNVRKAC